jgi:formylglycine-generating enzyme required for sulfatase activity
MASGETICVDAYEFPNSPSLAPRTSVNWEEATAICAKAGKRLCSLEELTTACKGEHDWTYPYGDRYIPGHCQDVEGALARGVAKPGCRSWWGAFHLVGNAWEWTSTPAGRTYYAHGGTYTGGPEDKCGRTTRSFFRQNRYDAVGFRCCEPASK